MDNAFTAIEAMACVNEHLNAGDVVGAQAIVMIIESEHATLPSSTMFRVLRAAMKAGFLTQEYRTWLENACGRAEFSEMVGA